MENPSATFRSGYVSLIGRPNVGKSTLLNTILGEKIAIVSPKPQTTRNKIIGIKTIPDAQIIFIDTPGIHEPKHKLGKAMVKSAVDALDSVDLAIYMVEPKEPRKEDRKILATMLEKVRAPVFLVVNKIDTVKKEKILPVIAEYGELYGFKEVIPISALKQDGTGLLLSRICDSLPPGPRYYPDELVTDQLERFMVGEIVREKIMASTAEELPYSVAIEVVQWSEREDGLISITCNIYVEREGQKAIIIGKKGAMLKSIGSAARKDIEALLHAKVFLELWIKVRKDWRNDDRLLRELGYR